MLHAASSEKQKIRQEVTEHEVRLGKEKDLQHERELLLLKAQHSEELEALRRRTTAETLNGQSANEAKLRDLTDQLLQAQHSHSGQMNKLRRERDDAVAQLRLEQDLREQAEEKHRTITQQLLELQASVAAHTMESVSSSSCTRRVDCAVNTDSRGTCDDLNDPNILFEVEASIMEKNKMIWELQIELQEARDALAMMMAAVDREVPGLLMKKQIGVDDEGVHVRTSGVSTTSPLSSGVSSLSPARTDPPPPPHAEHPRSQHQLSPVTSREYIANSTTFGKSSTVTY